MQDYGAALEPIGVSCNPDRDRNRKTSRLHSNQCVNGKFSMKKSSVAESKKQQKPQQPQQQPPQRKKQRVFL